MIKLENRCVSLLLGTCLASGAAWAEGARDDSRDTLTIETVIITAERRETSLQKTSLSVQVLAPDELAYVNRPQDLTGVAPGVQVGATGVNPQVFIRGVGDTAGSSRDTTSVNFSIDGVNFARASGATTSFFDLARVEVLKGPQGTLYGRNASGGAVNIITARPVLGETSGYVTGEYGSFDLLSGEGAVNLALGETVAMRIAAQIVDRDGYMSDGAQDQRTKSIRGRVLWEPNDRFSVLASADASHIGGNGSGNTVLPVYQNDPWRSSTEAPTPYAFALGGASSPYQTPTDRDVDADIFGVSAEVNVDLGEFATLTVLPAFRRTDLHTVAYSVSNRFAESTVAEQTSLEARLGHNSDRLSWVLGGYYFQETLDQQISAALPTLLPAAQTSQETVSKAAFGQATLSVMSGLRVIGGIRYSSETVNGVVQNGLGAQPLVAFTPVGNQIVIPDQTSSRTNYKAGIEADIAEESMFYATVSTGFKAGGYSPYNAVCGGQTSRQHDPEDVTAYSTGLRNRFFGGALQVNMEGFYWEYEGQQFSVQQQLLCGDPAALSNQRFVLNAGESTVKGANIDVIIQPVTNGALHFFAEYADGTYDDFELTLPTAAAANYAPARGSLCSYSPNPGLPATVTVDCSGQQLPRLAEWTLAADYQHSFYLENGGLIRPKVDLQYATSRWADTVYAPNGRLPAYTQVNAQISYTSPGDTWGITAYVRNLTKEKLYTGGFTTTVLSPNNFNYTSVTINPPRAYGVRVTRNF